MNQTLFSSAVPVPPSTKTTLSNKKTDRNTSVLSEGNILFRMGDQLDGVYQVNSGAIKLYTITESGDEHIIRFCMAGDLLGLEALSNGDSISNAVVLDIVNITFIPKSQILSNHNFNLSDFMENISRTINKEAEHSLMLSQCTASRRVAWFLVEFAERMANMNRASNEFLLPMIRADIALYLGLAIETVSRELSQFCKKDLIKKKLRHFEIIDFEKLKAISLDSSALH